MGSEALEYNVPPPRTDQNLSDAIQGYQRCLIGAHVHISTSCLFLLPLRKSSKPPAAPPHDMARSDKPPRDPPPFPPDTAEGQWIRKWYPKVRPLFKQRGGQKFVENTLLPAFAREFGYPGLTRQTKKGKVRRPH